MPSSSSNALTIDKFPSATTEITVSNRPQSDAYNEERAQEKVTRHVVFTLDDIETMNALYHQTITMAPTEPNVKPGTITALMFAMQLKKSQFLIATQELKSTGQTKVYSATVACRHQDWIPWITEIQSESEWFKHPDDTRLHMSRETTPDIILEFRQEQDFKHGIVSPDNMVNSDLLKQGSQNLENLLDIGRTRQISRSDFSKSDAKTLAPNPFLQEEQFVEMHDLTEVLSQTSDGIKLHSRLVTPYLSEIHHNTGIPIVFTDLYLNLINQMYNEWKSLARQAENIERLCTAFDSTSLKAYKMLLIYVRSTQPPFYKREPTDSTPVLHLELFYHILITQEREVRRIKVAMKHLEMYSHLYPGRYAKIIESLTEEKDRFFDMQQVGRSLTPRANRLSYQSGTSSPKAKPPTSSTTKW